MTETNRNRKELKFLRLFEEGKRFSEELMKENERLRLIATKLRTEKTELENRYVLVNVPQIQEQLRVFQEELTKLRKENQELKEQFAAVEEENLDFAERYVKVERQNCDLINMYVASYRLHSTLNYEEVLEIIKEIVINMVGAQRFGVYVADEQEECLVLVAHEGMDGLEGEPLASDSEPLAKALTTGESYVASPEEIGQDGGHLLACIPLRIGESLIGVVTISELLVQKKAFNQVDHEMFELLGKHAATAIYGASMFTKSERKRNTLEGFVDLLRTDLKAKALST